MRLSNIILKYVSLSDLGDGKRWVGWCPFHEDDSTNRSFNVDDESATFACRQCGAAGNADEFLRLMDALIKKQRVEEAQNLSEIFETQPVETQDQFDSLRSPYHFGAYDGLVGSLTHPSRVCGRCFERRNLTRDEFAAASRKPFMCANCTNRIMKWRRDRETRLYDCSQCRHKFHLADLVWSGYFRICLLCKAARDRQSEESQGKTNRLQHLPDVPLGLDIYTVYQQEQKDWLVNKWRAFR